MLTLLTLFCHRYLTKCNLIFKILDTGIKKMVISPLTNNLTVDSSCSAFAYVQCHADTFFVTDNYFDRSAVIDTSVVTSQPPQLVSVLYIHFRLLIQT